MSDAMTTKNTTQYAQHLYAMMGDKAEVYAAQQQAAFDRSQHSDELQPMRRQWASIREELAVMQENGSRYPRH